MKKHQTCSLCKSVVPASEISLGHLHRPQINQLIQVKYPNWTPEQSICLHCLNEFRAMFVRQSIESEKGELSALESEVIESMRQQEILSENLNEQYQEHLTLGAKLSDRIAEFGGSWRFLILFGLFILIWIVFNLLTQGKEKFDPYPFILLNLLLSCLAAIQAPVIMMSQNRQEAKDRLRAENDYRINLKAELEIQHLTRKLDQLMSQQWQRLLDIQEIQTELMQEITRVSTQKKTLKE